MALASDVETSAQKIKESLTSSVEVTGRVAGRGVKIERNPKLATHKGAFATVFYGLLANDGDHCRLAGHFQIRPVGRLFIGAWIVTSTLLALTLLLAAALRATPLSSSQEVFPFLPPVLLPFLGLAFARWQRRLGQVDEAAIRDWLHALQQEPTAGARELWTGPR